MEYRVKCERDYFYMVVKAGFDKQKLIIVSFAMFGLLWPVWNCMFRVNDLECVSKCRVCNGFNTETKCQFLQ